MNTVLLRCYALIQRRWFLALLFGLVFVFWPHQRAVAYYFGQNGCDQPTHIAGTTNNTAEYLSCGIDRDNGNNVGGAWGYDEYMYLPTDTATVQMVQSFYDDFGYTTVNSSAVDSTMSAYNSGQHCGSTAVSSYQYVPFTPGSYMHVNLYALDTCKAYQRADTMFYITYNPPTPTGWIAANPNPCQAAVGQTYCYTTLSWNVLNATHIQLEEVTQGQTYWYNYTDSSASVYPVYTDTTGVTYYLYGNGTLIGYVNTYAVVQPPGTFTLNTPTSSCGALASKPTVALTWSASPGATNYGVYVTANGVQTLIGTTSGTSLTWAAQNSTWYGFNVKAYNSAGSKMSPATGTQMIQTPNCLAALNLSVQINPIKAVVPPNGSQVFVAQGALSGNSVNMKGTGVHVVWSVTNATAGAIDQRGVFTASGTVGPYVKAVQVSLTYTLPDGTVLPPATSTADVTIVTPSQISGDVYTSGSVTNLSLDGNSVVSASGTVSVSGTNYTIPNYKASNSLKWDGTTGVKQIVQDQATTLINEHVNLNGTDNHKLGDASGNVTISSVFNLNPPANQSYGYTLGVNSAAAEGQVWYVPGNLTIQTPITFYGRGTIIVDGDVSIKGSGAMSYPGDRDSVRIGDTNASYPLEAASLGILLRCGPKNTNCATAHNVVVDSTVTSVVGAYFNPSGTIQFLNGDTTLNATGLFVSNTLNLDRKSLVITYDKKFASLTPPGFGVITVPSVKEATP